MCSVREKNTLRERKNSPATCMSLILSRGCVLFLTDLHRRTEHTAFHRDIKSTDITEHYCAQFRAHERVAPPPSPSPQGRGVVCEVTPIGLLVWGVGRFFSHRPHRSYRAFLRTFRVHRRPSAYRVHRGLTPSPSPNGEGSSM